jgi:hypothetical protein
MVVEQRDLEKNEFLLFPSRAWPVGFGFMREKNTTMIAHNGFRTAMLTDRSIDYV